MLDFRVWANTCKAFALTAVFATIIACRGPAANTASEVQVVYVEPPFPPEEVFEPLWGDRSKDQEPIAKLLDALASVEVVSGPEIETTDPKTEKLVVRYRNGNEVRIRKAYQCTFQGGSTLCRDIPGQWFIEGKGRVVSPELEDWFARIVEYMPPVKVLSSPSVVCQGGSFTVSGGGELRRNGWVRLSLKVAEGPDVLLGKAKLEYGAFVWQGPVPEEVPVGNHHIQVEFEGSVSVSQSVTVLEAGKCD